MRTRGGNIPPTTVTSTCSTSNVGCGYGWIILISMLLVLTCPLAETYGLRQASISRGDRMRSSMHDERVFYHDKPTDLPSLPDSSMFDPMDFVVDPAICYFDDMLR